MVAEAKELRVDSKTFRIIECVTVIHEHRLVRLASPGAVDDGVRGNPVVFGRHAHDDEDISSQTL